MGVTTNPGDKMNTTAPKIDHCTTTASIVDQVARIIATGNDCAELAPAAVDGGRVAICPSECGQYILNAGGRLFVIDDTSTGAAELAVRVWFADPGPKRDRVLARL